MKALIDKKDWSGKPLSDEEIQAQIDKVAADAFDWVINAGVYSMTSKKDDLLMWGHYADSHRGFVIGFDTASLKLNQYLSLVKVKYVDEYPIFDDSQLDITNSIHEHMGIVAGRKGKQWENEQEWRLVFLFKRELITMPMLPTEIIFGHRMQESHQNTLYQLVTEAYDSVEFFTTKPSTSKYELELLAYTTG